MRRLILVAGALAVEAGVGAVGQDLTDVQDSTARDMLRRSREALGAVDTLARLRSLLPTGTSHIPSDHGLVACDVEIHILLPDHYLRIDKAPPSVHGRPPAIPDKRLRQTARRRSRRVIRIRTTSTCHCAAVSGFD